MTVRSRTQLRLLVFTGGIVGTLLRVLVQELGSSTSRFPWPTLAVNLLGSVGLGFIVGRSLTRPAEARRVPFIGVGIMGALTTFGGVMVQGFELVADGMVSSAIAYVVTSVAIGLFAALVALRVGAAPR